METYVTLSELSFKTNSKRQLAPMLKSYFKTCISSGRFQPFFAAETKGRANEYFIFYFLSTRALKVRNDRSKNLEANLNTESNGDVQLSAHRLVLHVRDG